MILSITLFLLFHISAPLLSLNIQSKPLCSVYTPNSILEHKEHYKPLFIGNRERYATCTGATWFHQNYLAVLNLYGKKINTYKFYSKENRFEHMQEVNNAQGAQLTAPENLAVSPDGSLLAVCSASPSAGVNIYRINLKTHAINPKPIFKLKTDSLVHNVRFSPDGMYLAMTTWNQDAAVCIYRVLKTSRKVKLQRTFHLKSTVPHLAAKGINFTRDSKFVVIAYSDKASITQKNAVKGLIVIYSFDHVHGLLDNLVCSTDKGYLEFCYDDVAFIDHDRALIFSDQSNNVLTIYPFNIITGQIDNTYSCIQEKEAQLDFPHGIGVKQDGKYFVVTNYGDDKFNLYRI